MRFKLSQKSGLYNYSVNIELIKVFYTKLCIKTSYYFLIIIIIFYKFFINKSIFV